MGINGRGGGLSSFWRRPGCDPALLSSSRHSIIPYSLIIKIVAPLAAAALFRRAALRLIGH